MRIEKTSRVSLVEQVVLQIEGLIESGVWQVGSKLPPEMELMDKFGVSRNTLREAIRALVHAGLLQTKQGVGTYVYSSCVLGAAIGRRLNRSNLLETLEVRNALESEAAQLAALRRNDEDVHQLRYHLDACHKALQRKDRRAYAEADIQLHQAIVRAAHNSLLLDLYEYMTDALCSSVHDLLELISDMDMHQKIHDQLVDSIIAQNGDTAAKAVNEYMIHLKEIQIESLEEL